MLVLFVGLIALFVAYVLSHLVFATNVTGKRRLAFLLMSIASLYIAIGSVIFTVQ